MYRLSSLFPGISNIEYCCMLLLASLWLYMYNNCDECIQQTYETNSKHWIMSWLACLQLCLEPILTWLLMIMTRKSSLQGWKEIISNSSLIVVELVIISYQSVGAEHSQGSASFWYRILHGSWWCPQWSYKHDTAPPNIFFFLDFFFPFLFFFYL